MKLQLKIALLLVFFGSSFVFSNSAHSGEGCKSFHGPNGMHDFPPNWHEDLDFARSLIAKFVLPDGRIVDDFVMPDWQPAIRREIQRMIGYGATVFITTRPPFENEEGAQHSYGFGFQAVVTVCMAETGLDSCSNFSSRPAAFNSYPVPPLQYTEDLNAIPLCEDSVLPGNSANENPGSNENEWVQKRSEVGLSGPTITLNGQMDFPPLTEEEERIAWGSSPTNRVEVGPNPYRPAGRNGTCPYGYLYTDSGVCRGEESDVLGVKINPATMTYAERDAAMGMIYLLGIWGPDAALVQCGILLHENTSHRTIEYIKAVMEGNAEPTAEGYGRWLRSRDGDGGECALRRWAKTLTHYPVYDYGDPRQAGMTFGPNCQEYYASG